MAKVIGIGNDSYQEIREQDSFYIDKTSFIKDWWENRDKVTLITRPRRFGKTLNMDMLKCFFSNKYEGRGIYLRDLIFGKKRDIMNYRGHIR